MNIESVACIGTGIMGTALLKAIAKQVDSKNIIVSDIDSQKTTTLAQEINCTIACSNIDAVQNASCILLSVKPVYLPAVLEEIADSIKNTDKIIVSMAAGVTLETLSKYLGNNAKIVRIMPNIPALVGESMIGLSALSTISPEEINEIKKILKYSGIIEEIPESLMDGVTAISGSGPAYGFMFIEALADAAVRFGIPRKQAIRYAAQTLKGAAVMVLETGIHPGELKDNVCSPAGTTIEAVYSLEKNGFRSAIMEAAEASWKRSKELGKS